MILLTIATPGMMNFMIFVAVSTLTMLPVQSDDEREQYLWPVGSVTDTLGASYWDHVMVKTVSFPIVESIKTCPLMKSLELI